MFLFWWGGGEFGSLKSKQVTSDIFSDIEDLEN